MGIATSISRAVLDFSPLEKYDNFDNTVCKELLMPKHVWLLKIHHLSIEFGLSTGGYLANNISALSDTGEAIEKCLTMF